MVGSKYVFALVVFCFACIGIGAQEPNRLAVLIGADWSVDTASRNDVEAMNRALRARGFTADEIVTLGGNISRTMLVSFLKNIPQRTSEWKNGSIFLYYSGHGTYRSLSETEIDPGMWLNENLSLGEQKVSWREVFEILKPRSEVKLLVLPDN